MTGDDRLTLAECAEIERLECEPLPRTIQAFRALSAQLKHAMELLDRMEPGDCKACAWGEPCFHQEAAEAIRHWKGER